MGDAIQEAYEALSHLESEAHSLGMNDEHRHILAGRVREGLASSNNCLEHAGQHMETGTPETELPGMWQKSDFEGGDPDERSYAERNRADQPTAPAVPITIKPEKVEALIDALEHSLNGLDWYRSINPQTASDADTEHREQCEAAIAAARTAMINATPEQPAPVVPECPYPCGWDNLHAIATSRAAYFARATLDEETPEAVRTAGIKLGKCAIDLIRMHKQYAAAEPLAPAVPEDHEQLLDLRSDMREMAEREGGMYRHFYDRLCRALNATRQPKGDN